MTMIITCYRNLHLLNLIIQELRTPHSKRCIEHFTASVVLIGNHMIDVNKEPLTDGFYECFISWFRRKLSVYSVVDPHTWTAFKWTQWLLCATFVKLTALVQFSVRKHFVIRKLRNLVPMPRHSTKTAPHAIPLGRPVDTVAKMRRVMQPSWAHRFPCSRRWLRLLNMLRWEAWAARWTAIRTEASYSSAILTVDMYWVTHLISAIERYASLCKYASYASLTKHISFPGPRLQQTLFYYNSDERQILSAQHSTVSGWESTCK